MDADAQNADVDNPAPPNADVVGVDGAQGSDDSDSNSDVAQLPEYDWRGPLSAAQAEGVEQYLKTAIPEFWNETETTNADVARCVSARRLVVAVEAMWLSGEWQSNRNVILHTRQAVNAVWRSKREVEAYCIAGLPAVLIRLATSEIIPHDVQSMALSMLQWLSYRCARACMPHLDTLISLFTANHRMVQDALAFGGDLILVLDNEYADTKLHTIVTLFLNLALNIQTPEEGLLELRSQLVPSLLPTVSATERLNDAGPCIFSTLTLVIVCRREDVRRQCTFELEPFIVRCALALQSALHLDHEGYEGLLWSIRSPCMALEQLAGIADIRAEFISSGAIAMLLETVALSKFTAVDDNWADVHEAQIHACSALWQLTFGQDPDPALTRQLNMCLPGNGQARHATKLPDCLLANGLDALFLDPASPLRRAERVALLSHHVIGDGAPTHVVREVLRMATALYGSDEDRSPLALVDAARRSVRLSCGPRSHRLRDEPIIPTRVRRYLLYDA